MPSSSYIASGSLLHVQAFEHGMHAGHDEVAVQQQLAQAGYHQGSLDSYGGTASGTAGGTLLAGVPPELYQHHMAQQFLLFQQQVGLVHPEIAPDGMSLCCRMEIGSRWFLRAPKCQQP